MVMKGVSWMFSDMKKISRINLIILFVFLIIYLIVISTGPDFLENWFFTGAILTYGLGSGVLFLQKSKQQKNNPLVPVHDIAFDPLTGFPSRPYFETLFEELLKKAHQENSNISLVYFDLDRFKRWNENLSSRGREELIGKIATFLQQNTEKDVIKSRFWGDRFALGVPRGLSSSEKEFACLKEKLNETFFQIEDKEIKLQGSFGIAQFPGDGKKRAKLEKEAAAYLQQAKILGGNLVSSRKKALPLDFRKNIRIFSSGNYLDKISKRSTQLFLLYKDRDIEIIKQHIVEGKPFSVDSRGEQSGFEFFFILNGEIKSVDENKVFPSGSFITTGSLEDRKYFETVTPVDILYITNTGIFEEQSSHLAQWKKMVDRVKEKDRRIQEHSRRIETLAQKMGQALGLDGQRLFSLIYAAFLHDVGKTKVPGEVLQKAGPLNEEEWETVKKHPVWGKEIIDNNLKLNYSDQQISDIVYQHHENFDGTGYPRGLKGDEILLEAQILSLLDAFDAMTSERPYQSAKTLPEALEEIKRCSGTQFAPRVVDKFLELMEAEGEE